MIAVPPDLKPTADALKTLQTIVGARARVNESIVQVSAGSGKGGRESVGRMKAMG